MLFLFFPRRLFGEINGGVQLYTSNVENASLCDLVNVSICIVNPERAAKNMMLGAMSSVFWGW